MSVQQSEPALARQTCLKAFAIAIPIMCKEDQLNDAFTYKRPRCNQIQALRLCCKEFRKIVDDLGVLTRLRIFEGQSDFAVLTPALMKNVRHLDISPDCAEKHYKLIKNHLPELKRIFHLTAPNLHGLVISRVPAPLAVFIKGLSFSNLETLTLDGMEGSISGAKDELYSMQKLQTLSLEDQKLNIADGKVLLSAPFLSNLAELVLGMTARALTTEYMSNLLTDATSLKRLWLINDKGPDFNYFGSAKLENLEQLVFDNESEEDQVYVRFGPLLAQSRPNLRILCVHGGTVTTQELKNLLASGKAALPNLNYLSITKPFLDDSDSDDDQVPDWSCLSQIDFPNLVDLKLECHFKELLGLLQPTAKLPKLKSLDVTCSDSDSWPPRNYTLEILKYSEQLFSSPIFYQLTSLHIRSYYFRLDSLAVLCKYAPKMKGLRYLTVHSHDLEGVQMIANCGQNGGFPNLARIEFCDMSRIYAGGAMERDRIRGEKFQLEIRDCLRKVWPTIRFECHCHPMNDHDYGQPGEFYNPEFDEEGLY